MRVANCVVGQLQALVGVHLTAGPHTAIAVLVAGEILEDRLRLRAVRVSGIDKGNMAAGGEMAIGSGAAVEHEAVKVRMGSVALELPHLGSTWPGLQTGLRVFELTNTVLRQGKPETYRVGPRGHVVAVNIVRIGDPESRRRVVGREQDILGVLAASLEVRAVRRSVRREICWDARCVRMVM